MSLSTRKQHYSSELTDVKDLIDYYDWNLIETLQDISDMILHRTGIHLKLCVQDKSITFPSPHHESQFDSLRHWNMIFSFLWREEI
jgi:hypothetical protein